MSGPERRLKLMSVIHGPAFGGAHNQALRLREPLEERGIETLVILPIEAQGAAERLREAGTECLTVPLRRLRATASPAVQREFALNIRRDVRRLATLMREHEIDVVQVHGATNPHGAFAARQVRAAVVWQLFDTRAPRILRRVAMPMVVRLADAMTTWGRELAIVHPGAERLGDRLTVVYPPVDPLDFEPDSEVRSWARSRMGVKDSEHLVGAVGVLNPQKGHEYLIRAAELVARDRKDVQFRVLGGSSPAHAEYERALRDEARRRGLSDRFGWMNPGTDVAKLIQGFDVFAMTSVPRSEGMPTVILEAMNAQKPVVTTDVGAVRELVEADVSGLVLEPLRPDLMAAAIEELLADAGLGSRIAAAGWRRAHDMFDLETLADLHAETYRTAVRHAKSRR